MNLSQVSGQAGLGAILTLHNSGTLTGYSGTMPATPETALSGNTALVTATYSATAFGSQSVSGGYTQATASFTAASYAPVANGSITFCRAYESNGTTVLADYTVGFAWLASTVVAVGVYCTNGGNTYKCTAQGTTASSGGPTGTGGSIADGTATWAYQGAGTLFDVTVGNPNIQTGTNVQPSQVLKLPVV